MAVQKIDSKLLATSEVTNTNTGNTCNFRRQIHVSEQSTESHNSIKDIIHKYLLHVC
jgi:hypothetical protein